MGKIFIFLIAGIVDSITVKAQPKAVEFSGSAVETIISIRHGEKPPGGLGQLTCRGLNRSLALLKVLLEKYDSPQFISAPKPTQKVDAAKYFYVRPLANISPSP